MTTKEKKEYAILAVLVLATIGVVYFNFFKKPAAVVTTPGATPQPAGAVLPGANPLQSPLAVPGSAAPVGTVAPATNSSAFLPNGPKLDIEKVTTDKRFLRLQAPDYPTVTREELGIPAPF
jgi:hypothetical protein